MKKITYLCIVITLVLITDLSAQNQMQRVRIDFETPLGYTRQLLLSFTPDNAATDGFDYGYDGANIEDFPDDFSYIINGEKYVIQGVGAFDTSKKYPVGAFLTNEGTISISMHSIENFEEAIEVYIYDSLNDTYHSISSSSFQENMPSGDFMDRFYVAFSDANSLENLSATTFDLENLQIKYSTSTGELVLRSHAIDDIKNIEVFSILGQKITSIFSINDDTAKLRIPNQSGNVSLLRVTTQNGTFVKKVLLN